MLVLFETPAGFALFKVLDEGKLNKVEDIYKDFETPEAARKVVKLKAFEKFENTTDALGAATALVDSKLSKGLRKFLKEQCSGETLAIADSKLGRIISDKLEINCVHNSAIMELLRGVKSQVGELISGLSGQEMTTMSLGLAHSLSRYTLKFSPDKVDTMIVQAIGLLDDLDKELNTYAMRVREWYGWHFPELGKIVQDNIQYAQAVKLMGNRINAKNLDFSAILAEEIEAELKEAVIISMGTEVSDEDMASIKALCDQVISLSEYRGQLFDYLRSRMNAIAPNLTVLVGELVGARLIAHAGSLVNLAKQPASTVQILGAEKALFRALKTKNQTPKYGLIYHASLVGQAAPKFKGKISRVLAAKSVLSIRYDALGEDSQATIGFDSRLKVEARLRQLEGKSLGKSAVTKGKAKLEAYDKDRKSDTPALLTAAKTYNSAMDSTLEIKSKASGKRSKDEADNGTAAEEPPRKKKKHSDKGITIEDVRVEELPKEVVIEEPSKKKKKKNKSENNGKAEEDVNTKEDVKTEEDMTSKKKKKKAEKGVIVKEEGPADEGEAEEETSKEKKKKKKAQVASEDLTASEGSSKASKKRKTGGEAVPVDVSDSAEKKKKKKDKKKDRDA